MKRSLDIKLYSLSLFGKLWRYLSERDGANDNLSPSPFLSFSFLLSFPAPFQIFPKRNHSSCLPDVSLLPPFSRLLSICVTVCGVKAGWWGSVNSFNPPPMRRQRTFNEQTKLELTNSCHWNLFCATYMFVSVFFSARLCAHNWHRRYDSWICVWITVLPKVHLRSDADGLELILEDRRCFVIFKLLRHQVNT